MKEFSLYRQPDNPRFAAELLRRAHRASTASRTTSDRDIPVKQRQIQIAGAGAGGVQRSSPVKPLSPRIRYALEEGGWSEEEIKSYEQKLTKE